MSELINKINLRFESGNSVPVDSVRITREEWEEVQREVDDWKQQADGEAIVSGSYRDERDAALDREQALAAHVKEAKELIDAATSMGFFQTTHDSGTDHKRLCHKVIRFLQNTPEQTLARRDLIKQAEALEQIATDIACDLPDKPITRTIISGINIRIDTLRQQAEALK